MAKAKKISKEIQKSKNSPFKEYWNNVNYILLIVGLFALLMGYFLMSQGTWDNTTALTISPIILLISYLIIIPISIFITKKKS